MKQTLRRAMLALLVVASVLVPAVGSSFAQDTTDPTVSGRSFSNNGGQYLRLASFTNGGDAAEQEYTQQEALALAERLDAIVALRWTFDDYAEAMKRVNPDLTMFVYMNGAFSRPRDNANMPDAWFLKDSQGRRIKNLNFELWYMDMGNEGWRNWAAQRCSDYIRLSGYDGCYMDDMGVGNLDVNISGYPIDPRTNRPLEKEDWVAYGVGLTQVVKSKNAAHFILTNGLNNGGKYFGPTTLSYRYLNAADGAQAEGWIRGAYADPNRFRDEAAWKLDVDMIVDAGRRGKTTLLGTKIWEPASAARIEQWRAYSYASLLLGTDGHQYLFFSATGPGKADPPSPLDNFNIGRPLGSYAKRDGVYQRQFTGGRALVNPTTSTRSVNLGATYLDHSGNRVTSVTMGANTGLILRTPGFDPGDAPPAPKPIPPAVPMCLDVEATIIGTQGDDVLVGTDGNDVISARGGDDVIRGLGGNDIICAGHGADRIDAGDGRDIVVGGDGRDWIFGGAGRDRLFGNKARDKIKGGPNVDRIFGGPGVDTCAPDAADLFEGCP